MPLDRAIAWAILGAYLALPVRTEIDLPYVPAFDKTLIPNVVALVLCRLFSGERIRVFPQNRLARLLFGLFLFSPIATTLLNLQPLVFHDRIVSALTLYDAVSLVFHQFILVVPFILGRQFLATEEAHRTLLRVLVVAGLIYSVPMLFEVRMSPQLHTWIYGFFPHSFAQQIRGGGFRPVVFLGHGLFVALFAMTAAVAATALWRTRQRIGRIAPGVIAVYLTIVLVLCKTLSAFLYGMSAIFLLVATRPKQQLAIAAMLVGVVLVYPLMRGMDLVPTDDIVDLARSVSDQRAGSLSFRFENEEKLLEHANQRPIFGWGSWGRNRVFQGDDASEEGVTDGRWVITMGQFGWIGYIAEFGLLAFPIFLLWRLMRNDGDALVPETVALALIFAINVFDLLPNSALLPWTWLISGSLLGLAERKLAFQEE